MTNQNKPSKFQQLPQNGRTVPPAVLIRNRAIIRRQQAERVEPVVIETSVSRPYLGPFGAKQQEAKE